MAKPIPAQPPAHHLTGHLHKPGDPPGPDVPVFDLDFWLDAVPNIRDAIRWAEPSGDLGGVMVAYGQWPDVRKQRLRDAVAVVLAGSPTGLPDPPQNQVQLADGDLEVVTV